MWNNLRGLLSKWGRRPADGNGKTKGGAPVALDGRTAVALLEAWIAEAAALGGGAEDGLAGTWRQRVAHQPGLAATLETSGSREAVAAAFGSALAGLRSAAFLAGAEISAARDLLAEAARQHVPLVVHAACHAPASSGSGHQDYHALADSGAVLLFAISVQEAVDLTLAARHLAEHALVPVVVAMDAEATLGSTQDVRLPTAEALREYLGSPDDLIPCPTAAQRILFGEHRRRVPRRHDLSERMLLGPGLGGESAGLAEAAGSVYFQDELPRLLEESLSALKAGYAPIFSEDLDKSTSVLVVQGSAVETALALARRGRTPLGVVGVRCLRPFPGARLAELLRGKKLAGVLERMSAPEPPLLREVRGALARAVEQGRFGAHPGYPSMIEAQAPRLVSAVYGLGGLLRGTDLEALVQTLGSRSQVYLGLDFVRSRSAYPRREAMMDRLSRAIPGLEERSLRAAPGTCDLRPPGSLSVGILHRNEGPGENLARRLGGALLRFCGGALRVRTEPTSLDVRRSRVLHAPAPIADPGDDLPLDLVVALDAARLEPIDGAALLVCGREPHGLPFAGPVWRLPGGTDSEERLLGAVLGVLQGLDKLDPEGRRKLVAAVEEDWHGFSEEARGPLRAALEDGFDQVQRYDPAGAAPETEDVSAGVRRLAGAADCPTSPAGFWNRVGVLYRRGEIAEMTADPFMAGPAVPPRSSAVRDLAGLHPMLPSFEPDACTGCGRCWTGCPEAAVAAAALSPAALLEAGMSLSARAGAPADALRRWASQLPAAMGKLLSSQSPPTVAATLLREAFEAVIGKARLDDEKAKTLTQAMESVVHQIGMLRLAHPAPITGSGDGELLAIAVNPATCKACGICIEVCEPKALQAGPAGPVQVARARELWDLWESLPDVSEKTVERLKELPEVGPAAATLLSRACHGVMSGGDGAEPGSGERLALRLVLAAAERALQPIRGPLLQEIEGLRQRLAEAIRGSVADALPTEDLETLCAELEALGEGPLRLSSLSSRLESPASDSWLDAERVKRLVGLGKRLAALDPSLGSGPHELGRAPLGLVLAPGRVSRWAGLFPDNPFSVPVVVDATRETLAVALGVLEGQLRFSVESIAAMRAARDELAGARALPAPVLRYADLSEEERRRCPPILVVGTEDELAGQALDWLLSRPLPIKVLMLADPGSSLSGLCAADSAMPAMLAGRAFVLQSSPAAADHLLEGVQEAIRYDGPALIRVHAPSPSRDGFPPERLLEQLRLAIESRVHPLWSYDPRREGALGERLRLSGGGRAAVGPADWAVRQARFAGLLGSERLEQWTKAREEAWRTLEELASMSADSVRTGVQEELAEQHREELEALRRDYEVRLTGLREQVESEMAARVQERLRALIGMQE